MTTILDNEGYGSVHAWVEHVLENKTLVFCMDCDRSFMIPPNYSGSICGLIFAAGIADRCKSPQVVLYDRDPGSSPSTDSDTDSEPIPVPATSSDIIGSGYGHEHTWRIKWTAQVGSWGMKRSLYVCQKCKQEFTHFYELTPDIFKAMKYSLVPERCTSPRN